jgi:ABC-type multidrug transport system fused ATPase/permease subunit
LRKFVKNHKKIIIFLVVLTLIETLIGLALPTISHFYLEKSFDLMNYLTFLYVGISLVMLIILFLINAYYRIYIGQKLSLIFINEIREAWYIYFLKHSAAFRRKFDGKKLITKLLYHVQLLKLGLNNIMYQGLQAIFLYFGIIIFSFIFNPKLFLVLWLSLPIIIIIFLVMDYIGRYYVTREQTFNSRIVAHLADSLLNFDVLKRQAREEEKLKEFANLIELDTYFRVRRQLWVQYSNRVLYGVILLFGVLLYFVQIYWPFIQFDSVTNVASTGLILGFFVRVLFSFSRCGVFFEAFRLGLRLSIPTFAYTLERTLRKMPKWEKLRFHSQKTKLSKYGSYIKNFELNINKKSRISIFAKDSFGKSTLASVITGQKCIESMIVNIGKKRITPKAWCSYKSDNYLITVDSSFETTIGEYLFGKSKSKITRSDVDDMYVLLKPYNFFDFLFSHKNLLGRQITSSDLSLTEIILLQIAHCIVSPKYLIAIDHSCMDQSNEVITEALRVLEQKSKNTAFIFFSSSENNILKYEKVFEISKREFKQI